MELPDVVADDRRLPGDGRSHGYSLQRPDGQGKGDRLRRSDGEKAYLLCSQEQEQRGGRRSGHDLLQRHGDRPQRAEQGEGRKRHEAGREIPQGRYLPGVPRHKAFRRSQSAETDGHFAGGRLSDDAEGLRRMGEARAGVPAGRNAEYGGKHLRVLSGDCRKADGPWAGLSDAGQSVLHALHRRAAADAARKGGAQPDDGRFVCSGRAFHRSASGEHRRSERRDARSHPGRQLRPAG